MSDERTTQGSEVTLESLLDELVEVYATFSEASYHIKPPEESLDSSGNERLSFDITTKNLDGKESWRAYVYQPFSLFEDETWLVLGLRCSLVSGNWSFRHIKSVLSDYDTNIMTTAECYHARALCVTLNTLLGNRVFTHRGKRYRVIPFDIPTVTYGAQERLRSLGFESWVKRPCMYWWRHEHCNLWWYPINGSKTHEGGPRFRPRGDDFLASMVTFGQAMEIFHLDGAWMPWRSTGGEWSLQGITTWVEDAEQLRAYLTEQRERTWNARRIRDWR